MEIHQIVQVLADQLPQFERLRLEPGGEQKIGVERVKAFEDLSSRLTVEGHKAARRLTITRADPNAAKTLSQEISHVLASDKDLAASMQDLLGKAGSVDLGRAGSLGGGGGGIDPTGGGHSAESLGHGGGP